MLRIALPNKGALSEETMTLVKEAGYKCRRSGRELSMVDTTNDVEFVFLRPRDIAIYVSNATLDLGITGRDLALDSSVEFEELLPLNFGRSTFRYAIPKEKDLTPDQFEGLRIATSYANLVRTDLEARKVNAQIVRLDGAVEISIQLGVADAIADVVESGRTLKEAGLKVIGDSILKSEAILMAQSAAVLSNPAVSVFVERLRGILVAREYVVVEYDCPKSLLEEACRITPGLEAPTISPLSDPEWLAVKAMTKRSEVNTIMDDLSAVGAKGIIVSSVQTCRL